MSRRTTIVWICILAAAVPLLAQTPNPEVRSRIDGFFRALAEFDPAAPDLVDRLRREAYTPELQQRLSAERNRALFAEFRKEFGTPTLAGVRRLDEGKIVLSITGSTGQKGRIALGLESASPYRITGIGLDVGGRDDEGPEPPINGRMSAEELTSALEPFVAALTKADTFSGVVLIAKSGTPIFERAYGHASREENRPNTMATRFNIGSINKSFTRVAVAQLMAEGKLALADTIGKILPDYPNKDAHPATLEQLLEHRGGIADIFGPVFESTPKSDLRSNADYLRLVAAQPLTFPPGTARRYCNGCYVVIGAMIERVTGLTYEQYVDEHIFRKAGMRTAGFLELSSPDVAMTYTRRGGSGGAPRASRETHGARGSAAGGAFATARDLLAFDEALRTGRLLNPTMTEWYFGGRSITPGRAVAPTAIAGGSTGLNADLESDGTWTVAVLANLDPPAAEQLGAAIMRKLRN